MTERHPVWTLLTFQVDEHCKQDRSFPFRSTSWHKVLLDLEKSSSQFIFKAIERSRPRSYRKRCLFSKYHRRTCKSQNLSKPPLDPPFPRREDSREQLVTTASPNVFKATRHLSSTTSQPDTPSMAVTFGRLRTSGCCIATRSPSLQPWWGFAWPRRRVEQDDGV